MSSLAPLLLPVLALLAEPIAVARGPLGIFHGGGRTWLVDVGEGRLYQAPGHLTVGLAPGSPLTRLRQRVEAHRPRAGASGLPIPASRRTVWERVATPSRAWQPTFGGAEPWPTGGESVLDERALVQFTIAGVSLVHLRRATSPDGAQTQSVVGERWSPDGLRAESAPEPDAAALAWLNQHLPFPSSDCAAQPAGRVEIEGPAGAQVAFLLATSPEARCLAQISVRPLGETPPPLPEGVLDRRPLPDGSGSLVLVGERSPGAVRSLDDLMALSDPCAANALQLERTGATPIALGQAPGLSGLQWLEADAAWRHWTTVFAPAERCGAAAPIVEPGATRVDGDLSDWPASALGPTTPLCRLVESGRAWGGPTDLSAAVAVRLTGAEALVAIDVRDVDLGEGDVVRLLGGAGDVTVDREGRVLSSTGAAKGRRIAVGASPRASGYALEVRLPRALLGDPPALAVAVDDTDGTDRAGAALRLWVAGEPNGTRGGRPLLLGAATGP